MSRHSGEQARRQAVTRSIKQYSDAMDARDRMRMVQVLRHAADRIEAKAKGRASRASYFKPTPGAFMATDHAVCRFMERAMGIDVAAIRQEIGRAIPANAMTETFHGRGSHGIVVRDGLQFLITPLSVISVLTSEMDASDWLESEELEVLVAAQ